MKLHVRMACGRPFARVRLHDEAVGMEVVDALTWHGGVAPAALLLRLTSRRRLRTAVRTGRVVRPNRGWYALRDADDARRTAARLSGVASHLSAAQLNGWELKWRPDVPTITVPRNRKVERWRREGVDVRWRDLDDDEVWNGRRKQGARSSTAPRTCRSTRR